ncbi:MAG: hypothetical protein ACRDF8_09060, partial [Chloroflexota bacterium]
MSARPPSAAKRPARSARNAAGTPERAAGSRAGGSAKDAAGSARPSIRPRRDSSGRILPPPGQHKPRIPWWVLLLILVFGTTVLVIVAEVKKSSAPTSASLLLAAAPGLTQKQPIDGIPCGTMEQVAYHVHAHLAVYVNGKQRLVPEGIGIALPRVTQSSTEGPFVVSGSCFYWLHTHTNDGIIHIESPAQQPFTLGQFFDIWGQALSTTQVGPAAGPVHAYMNGAPFTGDPRG